MRLGGGRRRVILRALRFRLTVRDRKHVNHVIPVGVGEQPFDRDRALHVMRHLRDSERFGDAPTIKEVYFTVRKEVAAEGGDEAAPFGFPLL